MPKRTRTKRTEESPAQEAVQEQPTYEVGFKRPPLHSQFSSDNQPENRGRKPGSTTFRKEAIRLLQGMADAAGGEYSAMGVLARQLVALCIAPQVNGQEVSPNVKLAAIREMLDRLEGKPLQSLIVNDEQAIELPLEWIIPIEVLENDSNNEKAEREAAGSD